MAKLASASSAEMAVSVMSVSQREVLRRKRQILVESLTFSDDMRKEYRLYDLLTPDMLPQILVGLNMIV